MFVPSPRVGDCVEARGSATLIRGRARSRQRRPLAIVMIRRVDLSLAVALASAPVAAQAGASAGGAPDAAAAAPAVLARSTRDLAGWLVHVDERLFATERPATEHALALLGQMLAEIVRVVPAPAVTALRAVPLYVSPSYPGQRSGAEYHPGAAWLRDHGRDPAMARAVEFSGVADFEAEMRRMPNFALHELAHAYHDRVLPRGFANPAVLQAYAQAKAGGRYDRVARSHGNGRPDTTEAAYALTNAMEYFAEGTEAFFARNDFAPFTRGELLAHDPVLHDVLAQAWGVAAATPSLAANDPAVGALAQKRDAAVGAARSTFLAVAGALLAVLLAVAVCRRAIRT
jgi:hypothetical protein